MYLKHYRNDIAISYAAADNLPFPNETSGWMDNLLKHLQWYVRRELKGADYQLWSPEDIGGHQVIPDERLAQLQNSATIVLLLSKTYLQTPHYQTELNAILNHVPVPSQRLFVVELNQVIRPEPLRAMRGYRLWSMDSRGHSQPLGFLKFQSKLDETDYYNQLQDLARDLSSVLEQLREQATPKQHANHSMVAKVHPQVLLAAVTNDLYMRREEVKRYLEQNGIGILPIQRYPLEDNIGHWQAAFIEDLAKASAFVQLLSDSTERLTTGISLPRWQFATVQCVKPDVQILQWRPPNIQVEHLQDQALFELLMGTEVRVTDLERFKSEIVRQVHALTAPDCAISNLANGQTSPYPGLRAFAREEVGIFFGRQAHVLQLLESLQRFPFLAIVGPSGYGKSSLVRSGLLPALEAGLLTSASRHWQVVMMRPGTALFTQLAASLWAEPNFQSAYTAGVAQMDASEAVALLAASLQRGPSSLTELLTSLALPDDSNVLVAIDQFEEIFRYYRQGAAEQAAAFVQLLLHSAVGHFNGRSVYVVLTMRSDFLGDCAVFEGLPEAINQGLFLIPRMTREQLRLAIIRPAEVFGGQVAPVLLNQLLNDGGDTPDQLPVLQHALLRMWDLAVAQQAVTEEFGASPVLTLEHYQQIGGLQDALSRHADEVLFSLPDLQQRIAELLFKCLTERGERERDTRRPVYLREVVALVAATEHMELAAARTEVMAVIEAFRGAGRHFLTLSFEASLQLDSIVDISHESFIRQWRRLQNWVDDEAEHAEQYQRLLDAASRYQQRKAGLWHTLELESGLRWRASFKPTAVWAQRYARGQGSEVGFEGALRFLDESLRVQLAENQKRRLRVQSLVALLVLVVGMAGFAWYLFGEVEEARNKALLSESSHFAELARQELQKNLTYTAAKWAVAALPNAKQPERPVVAEAQQALFDSFQKPGVLEHPAAVRDAVFSPDGKQLLSYSGNNLWLWDAQTDAPPTILQGHQDSINSAAFSADGALIISASNDKTARLWDTTTNELLAILEGHKAIVNSAAFSADDQLVVTTSQDNTAKLWNAKNGSIVANLEGHQDWVFSATFSADNKRIVTTSDDQTVRLWDAKSGQEINSLKLHENYVMSETFSVHESRIIAASNNGTAKLWDVASDQLLATLEGHKDWVFSAEFSVDGSHIVTASNDGTAKLWHAESGQLIATLQNHQGWWSAAFSADGSRIVSTSSDRTARVWDTANGKQLVTLRGHQDKVWSAAFSNDGSYIVTASKDRTARLWYAKNGQPLGILQQHQDRITSVAFSVDGLLVTTSDDQTARVWNAVSGQPIATLKGHKNYVASAVFNADGSKIVTASVDNTAKLWDTVSGSFIATLEGHQDYVTSAMFNIDGSLIVTASNDGTAKVWRAANHELLFTLEGHKEPVWSAEFSADGSRIVTASVDKTAKVWSTASGDLIADLKGHQNEVRSAKFSNDGTRILTASYDKTARLWNVEDNQEQQLAIMEGHEGIIRSTAFNADGTRIVTASYDQTARLWNAMSGELLAILKGHKDALLSAEFSADGTRIVTASYDQTAKLWNAENGELLATINGHQGVVNLAVFSPDDTRIVTASSDNTARIWRTFPDLTSMIKAAEHRTRFHHLTCKQRKQFSLLEKNADCPPEGK